jgi:hypothetical protein
MPNASCDEMGETPFSPLPTLTVHLQHAMKKYSSKQAGCGFWEGVSKKTLLPNTFQPQALAGFRKSTERIDLEIRSFTIGNLARY